jgi:hypothetical protein
LSPDEPFLYAQERTSTCFLSKRDSFVRFQNRPKSASILLYILERQISVDFENGTYEPFLRFKGAFLPHLRGNVHLFPLYVPFFKIDQNRPLYYSIYKRGGFVSILKKVRTGRFLGSNDPFLRTQERTSVRFHRTFNLAKSTKIGLSYI